jgi:hypothetical protein
MAAILILARRNDDGFQSLIIVGVIAAVVVTVFLVSSWRRRKRTEAMQRLADELGLTFAAQGGDQMISELGWCELFSRGRSKRIVNFMYGSSEGRQISVFDYEFVTGHGKSKRTNRQTVACLRFDGPQLPGFTLRQEGMWDKITAWFGGTDIDFETHPEFSGKYVVRGESEMAVRVLFSHPVLEFYQQHPGFNTEGLGHTFVFYRNARLIPPLEISQFLAGAFEALALFRASTPVESRGAPGGSLTLDPSHPS